MKYRALILAAGRGSRMGSETDNKPKCLTYLGGKTLLEWQLNSLNRAGIENISIVKGYKAEKIEGNFSTHINPRWAVTNMVYSLFCAPDFEGTSILSYSDIVYHPSHVHRLMETDGDIVITADKEWLKLWSLRFDNPLDDAESFKSQDNILKEIGYKTSDITDINAQYMGLLKLSSKGWDIMKTVFENMNADVRDRLDMTTMLNMLLTNGEEIKIVFVEGKWCEADSVRDVEHYENQLKKNREWVHDWR